MCTTYHIFISQTLVQLNSLIVLDIYQYKANMNANDNNNEQQQHDNSATLPRSNISSPQHATKQQQQTALSQNTSTSNYNTNNSSSKIVEGKASSPAVVELSSLFQTESTLFRDESQHSSGKFFIHICLQLRICRFV